MLRLGMNSMKLERMCKIFWTVTFFAMRMLIARASFSKLSAWYDFLSADHFTEKELLGRIVVVREFLSTEINPMASSHHGFSQHAIRFEEINSLIKFNKMCKIVWMSELILLLQIKEHSKVLWFMEVLLL